MDISVFKTSGMNHLWVLQRHTQMNDMNDDNKDLFPNITSPDIVNYLVFRPSAITHDQLKAYKSLESYNFFMSGWVRDVKANEK